MLGCRAGYPRGDGGGAGQVVSSPLPTTAPIDSALAAESRQLGLAGIQAARRGELRAGCRLLTRAIALDDSCVALHEAQRLVAELSTEVAPTSSADPAALPPATTAIGKLLEELRSTPAESDRARRSWWPWSGLAGACLGASLTFLLVGLRPTGEPVGLAPTAAPASTATMTPLPAPEPPVPAVIVAAFGGSDAALLEAASRGLPDTWPTSLTSRVNSQVFRAAHRTYSEGYAQFRAGNYKVAATLLTTAVPALSESWLEDDALYWLVRARTATGEESLAKVHATALATRYPESPFVNSHVRPLLVGGSR